MVEIDPFRAGKAYTIAEAARYAKTTPQTIRRWVYGDDHPARRMEPVFGDKAPGDDERLELSFLDLAELSVAVQFTKRRGKLQKVRAARERASHDFPELTYPFASLRLRQLGGEILHLIDEEMGGEPLAQALSLGGIEGVQYVLPAFARQALDLFDFDPLDTMATRWFPAGRGIPLVIDPKVAGGRLSIAGHGVTVETIRRRCLISDEDWEFVADDLDLDLPTIHAVIRYITPVAA